MGGFLANNVVIALVIITLITVVIIQIVMNKKTKEQLDVYFTALNKLNEYDNVEEAFKNFYQKLEQTGDFCAATKQRCEETENKMQRCIQKVGIVKYSTHDTGKNELSFAIALLDNNNDGIILNEVHTSTVSNIYAKQIEQGKSEARLSEEEAIALDRAIKDKDFVKREKK